MEEILRKGKRLFPAPSPIIIPGFTATELAAAEQLVQLSESSADSSPQPLLQRSLSSALSSSSSPISVGSIARPPNRHPLPFSVAEEAEDEDDDGGFKRIWPRYRPIAEIYADCIRVCGDGRRWAEAARKRKKREDWG